jgi:hypothetical protein
MHAMCEPGRRTVNKLAKQAIEVHGGLERWNHFTTLSAHLIHENASYKVID